MPSSVRRSIKLVTFGIPLSIIFLGIFVLFGWVLNIENFIRVLPGLSGMNPLTAILFIALSASVLMLHPLQKSNTLRVVAGLLVLTVALTSILRIVDIFQSDAIGVDLLFFRQRILDPASPPARMAFATSVALLTTSIALVMLTLRQKKIFLTLGQIFLMTTFFVTFPALLFYLGSGVIFLQTPFYFSMALHTALAFVLISLSMLVCMRDICSEKLYILDLRFIISLLFLSIPVWVFVVSPAITKMPRDFHYEAEIYSIDNLYDETAQQYSGEIKSNTRFYYEVEDIKDGIYEIKNIFDVRTPTGDKIFSVERLYGIDPNTKQHVSGYGDRDRNGYLFAPKNLDKQDFYYWHVNYDEPALMKFVGEEQISGLTVYKYNSKYQADQTKDLQSLPGVGDTRGINLDIDLTLWIEPTVGHLVKYEDNTIAYYYDLATGERLHPWNNFKNSYSSRAIEEQVSYAQQEILQKNFVEKTIPLFLFILAVLSLGSLLLNKYNKNLAATLLPLIILLASLGITITVWQFAKESVARQARAKFEQEIASLEENVKERLEIYSNVLYGGRGLFDASEEVTRDEWKAYIDGVNIQKNYPGVQGIGYAAVLKPNEVSVFENKIRSEGFPDFKVFPEGQREVYTSIQFLEPFDFRNQRAFGYDMFSEATRRAAMEYARDNDTAAITGKVLLLPETQEDIQAGFLMYLPVYSENNEPIGYVYSPFRMRDFMQATLFNSSLDVDLEIFDGTEINDDTEMFDADEGIYSRDPGYTPRFEKNDVIGLYGHTWTFRYITSPDFGLGEFQENYPQLVLRVGVVLSFLLAVATYGLASSRARAVKLAEEITRDLKEQKDKDEAILTGIGEGLTATDEKGNIILANPAFTQILGWGENEVIGKKMSEIIPMEDENGSRVQESDRPLSKVLNTGKSINTSNKIYLRKDGTKVPVEITVTPIIREGKVNGIIEIFRDIAKEKEVDRMKTEFLSLASHQLRTPLSAMKWFLEILLDNSIGKLNKQQQEMAQKTQQSNNRMIELVNSLLNVSRLEQGRIMVEPVPTDLIKLLDEVLTELQPQYKAKSQKINRSIPKEKITLNIDPKLIRQVYLNLLSNAIKYSPEKSTIQISVTKDANNIVSSVSDRGYGIPKAEQEKIFEKFYRASNIATKDTEGNGLGLYLVKQVVEVSGGKIWFESVEGKGTTFSFSLPLSGSKMKKGEKSLEG